MCVECWSRRIVDLLWLVSCHSRIVLPGLASEARLVRSFCYPWLVPRPFRQVQRVLQPERQPQDATLRVQLHCASECIFLLYRVFSLFLSFFIVWIFFSFFNVYIYVFALFVQLPFSSLSCAGSSWLPLPLVSFPSFSLLPTPNWPCQSGRSLKARHEADSFWTGWVIWATNTWAVGLARRCRRRFDPRSRSFSLSSTSEFSCQTRKSVFLSQQLWEFEVENVCFCARQDHTKQLGYFQRRVVLCCWNR